MSRQKKILGIIGGMGAKAGAAFYDRLVDLTPAHRDQDHIEVVLHANTSVPDRTEGILGIGPDPYPALLDSVRKLEGAGAQVIAIACVSAHYYIPRLREEATAVILNAVDLTVGKIMIEAAPDSGIGVLGTTGAIKSELFQNALEREGLRPVILPSELQESLVMEAIYGAEGIKAGKMADAGKRVAIAAAKLADMGAEAIIIGCSELPLVLKEEDCGVRLYDSMEILAREAVNRCFQE